MSQAHRIQEHAKESLVGVFAESKLLKRFVFILFQMLSSLAWQVFSVKGYQLELLFLLSGHSYWPSILLNKLILYGRIHEKEVSDVLVEVRGKIFVDIGASFGYYSLLLANNFEKIYAFEPSKEAFTELSRNLCQFKVKNVIPVMKAVSDTNSEEMLVQTVYGHYHKLISDTCLLNKVSTIVSSQLVETVTVESYFPKIEIDLIKVDVEGSEWRVLKGSESIVDNIKRWAVELHDPKRKREIEEWFISHGYLIRWLDFRRETANHIYAWRGIEEE